MSLKTFLFAACLAVAGQSSFAAVTTVTSNDADCSLVNAGRVFSVTADEALRCLFAGPGNINGNTNDQGGAAADGQMVAAGWSLYQAENDFGVGGQNTGAFSIDMDIYDDYFNVAIGFKTGEGQADPDFAIFEFKRGTSGGSFLITPTQAGGFSHAVIWVKGDPDTDCKPGDPLCGGNETPEPGSLALVGLGLLGAGYARRRRS